MAWELGNNTLIYARCRLWVIFYMQCPEGSMNEKLPLRLLVPDSSLCLGNREKLFQDPWQGRHRPRQVLWLQHSLTSFMFEDALNSTFTFGSLIQVRISEYLVSYSALPSAVQLSCHLLFLSLFLRQSWVCLSTENDLMWMVPLLLFHCSCSSYTNYLDYSFVIGISQITRKHKSPWTVWGNINLNLRCNGAVNTVYS